MQLAKIQMKLSPTNGRLDFEVCIRLSVNHCFYYPIRNYRLILLALSITNVVFPGRVFKRTPFGVQ